MSDDEPRATNDSRRAANDPQRAANERRDELTDHVEHILETVGADAQEGAYPVESEELAAEYRSTEFELTNETESVGSAFDRLADEYDAFATPDEAREALTAELDRADAYDEAFNDRRGTAAGGTVPGRETATEHDATDDEGDEAPVDVDEGTGDAGPDQRSRDGTER